MRCLITNDDGVDAPGLRALQAALRGRADVVVVAPAAEWSGCGHGAPPSAPVAVRRVMHPTLGEVHVTDGRPAECVRFALHGLLDPPPEVVVCGINRGGNSGVDIYYSGTVGAAREGFILGCPALAISQLIRRELPEDWDLVTARARVVLDLFFEELGRRRRPFLWNVNLPHLPPGVCPRGIAEVPVATAPLHFAYERAGAQDGAVTYRYCGRYFERAAPQGTDVHYLFEGWVTLSELTTDVTSPQAIRAERPWTGP